MPVVEREVAEHTFPDNLHLAVRRIVRDHEGNGDAVMGCGPEACMDSAADPIPKINTKQRPHDLWVQIVLPLPFQY